MEDGPFRQTWSGVVALVAAPIAIVLFSVIGGWGSDHIGLNLTIGLGLAAVTVVLLVLIWAALAIVLTARVRNVRAVAPGATVFASMRTTDAADAFAQSGVQEHVPAYFTVAMTRGGVQAWWDGALKASFPWGDVRELGAGVARYSFGGRAGAGPALMMSLAPASAPRMTVALPVIDHRIPIIWFASSANRVLEAARSLRAQASR